MDLVFPHHESEIAQAVAANGHDHVKYWMHNNMITINGQKMGKSLNNFITLEEFFSGNHEALQQAYSPITIRFFILQAHYRSTVDFSNEALQAAEKGMMRMLTAIETLDKLTPGDKSTMDVAALRSKCYQAMNDDFNSPILIAHLFDGVKMINSIMDGKASITADDLELLKKTYHDFVFDVLGLKNEVADAGADNQVVDGLMALILDMRKQAKANKDWGTADKIRDSLKELSITVKDTKEGAAWEKV
jgi:cysteinyl-tRNA synthetase